MAREVGSLYVTIGANLNKLVKGLVQAKNLVVRFASAVDRLGMRLVSGAFNVAATAVAAFATAMVAAGSVVVVQSAKMAAAAEEIKTFFDVSFEGSADAMRKWTNDYADSVGRSVVATERMMAIMNNMIHSMGLSSKHAMEMSKDMTRLAYGLSSIHDIPVADAFEKVQSALVGMPRPMQNLGYNIKETAIEEYALRQGWIEQGEKLSEVGKVYARYGRLLQVTKLAQDDIERTLGSTTNRARSLAAAWTDLRERIGSAVLEGEGAKGILTGLRILLKSIEEMLPSFGQGFAKAMLNVSKWVVTADIKFQLFKNRLSEILDYIGYWVAQAGMLFENLANVIKNFVLAPVDSLIEETVFKASVGLERLKMGISKIPGLGGVGKGSEENIARMRAIHAQEVGKRINKPVEEWRTMKPWDPTEFQVRRDALQKEAKERVQILDKEMERLRKGVAAKPYGGVAGLGALPELAQPKKKKEDRYKVEVVVPRYAKAAGGLGIESFATRERVSRMRTEGAFGPRMRIVDTELQQLNEQKKTNELLERYLGLMQGRETLDVWG